MPGKSIMYWFQILIILNFWFFDLCVAFYMLFWSALEEAFSVEENERLKGTDFETSEDEKKRYRSRSLKKKAISASTRLTHGLRKRSKRVADCRYESVSIEDVRDAEEQKAVNAFRQALIANDLLPPRHDDYHTLLRYFNYCRWIFNPSDSVWNFTLNIRLSIQNAN